MYILNRFGGGGGGNCLLNRTIKQIAEINFKIKFLNGLKDRKKWQFKEPIGKLQNCAHYIILPKL